mgnify:CR=1 FL=1
MIFRILRATLRMTRLVILSAPEGSHSNMPQNYFVYIATNKINTVLYTGITNDLRIRMQQHQEKIIEGFTSQYNVNKLIFYEIFDNPDSAISAEKRIKGWTRDKKLALIKEVNPEFKDLLSEL